MFYEDMLEPSASRADVIESLRERSRFMRL
jgi:hypothetical protein